MHFSCKNVFSAKIICAGCGGFYGSKISHSNHKNRKVFWRCNHFYDKGPHSPSVDDSVVKQRCCDAILQVIRHHRDVIETCAAVLSKIDSRYSSDGWLCSISTLIFEKKGFTVCEENICRNTISSIVVTDKKDISVLFLDGLLFR